MNTDGGYIFNGMAGCTVGVAPYRTDLAPQMRVTSGAQNYGAFDIIASHDNATYGASNTVQPASLAFYFIIKY